MKPDRKEQWSRRAFLLPSLFTTGNLFLGFFAIVQGIAGHFELAAILVFTAGILDGLDGRIARMTHTESDFGREFDSLADLTTFGLAPALLTYLWGLNQLGRIGWLVPFFYVVCAAARLARFNVQKREGANGWFVGLPAPAAGGALASVLFIAPDNEWKAWLNGLLLVVVLLMSLLMVSTFRYIKVPEFDLRKAWPYRVVLPLAIVLLVFAYHPPAFFVSVAALYTMSGPLSWLRSSLKRRAIERSEASFDR